MTAETQPKPKRGAMFWIGWVLTILPCAGLFMGAFFMANPPHPPEMVEEMGKLGWDLKMMPTLAVIKAASALLYLIPQTAVLGAILVTGYLGGAIAAHVRVGDGFVGPIIIGVLVWLGLFFRDPRVRALVPWRR